MWRYIDLLPVESTSIIGPMRDWTPLVRAKNLGAHLGIDELYIKNDTVNHPTLSFQRSGRLGRPHARTELGLKRWPAPPPAIWPTSVAAMPPQRA